MEVIKDQSQAKSVTTKEVKEPKLTEAQLKELANKLFNENRYLKQQLQQAIETINTFNRLNYLFKVIEVSNSSGVYKFSSEFVQKCMDEVENIMTIPEEQQEEEKEG